MYALMYGAFYEVDGGVLMSLAWKLFELGLKFFRIDRSKFQFEKFVNRLEIYFRYILFSIV